MDVTQLLKICVDKNASDLHLCEGAAPYLRIDGELAPIEGAPVLNKVPLIDMLSKVMTSMQLEKFKEALELDFALSLPDIGRFRVNVFHESRGVGGVFRVIPPRILGLEELGLPEVFKRISELPNGLVLITGPTGSGKSTTLAAMIDSINQHRARHILTIEDPIEYLHENRRCLINQREINRDTKSFHDALRSALREDPDVILVGELRDLETIRLALTAAETGHLVFATVHTSSAAKTVNRMVDVFPSGEKAFVRNLLAESLQAVISQTLLKRIGGGRVAALEVMVCNAAIRNLIREDKLAQIYSVMQTGAANGMHTLDQYLRILVTSQAILKETAYEVATDKQLF